MSVEKLCSESSTCGHIVKPEYYTRAMSKAHGGYSLVPFLLPQDTDLSPECQQYRSRFCDISIDSIHDFDLSTSGEGNGSMGNLHTGTQPFMAMDLLEKAGRKGHIPHLYRHDLESFIWLLVWYSAPKMETYGTPLDANSWATSTAEYCYDKKNSFWTNYTKYTSDNHKRLFKLCKHLIREMNKKVFRPMKLAMEYEGSESDSEAIVPRSSFTEPSSYELFKALQKIVLAKHSFLEPSVMERLKEKEGDKR